MNIDLNKSIFEIMTTSFKYVELGTSMTQIAALFDKNSWHHLPVLDNNMHPIGIISKNDYNRLQHPFTKLFESSSKDRNKKLFESLTAEDVMTPSPTCIHFDVSLASAIGVFLENKFHLLPVIKDDQCIGVISPYDILQYINITNLIPSES